MISRKSKTRLERFIDPDSPVISISTKNPVKCRETDRIDDIMHHFVNGFRRLPVTDSKGRCVGVLSATDILDSLTGHKKTRVCDCMSRVFSIHEKETVGKALDFFIKNRRGGYPVISKSGPKAIITESDFVHQIHRPLGLKIGEVMTRKPMIVKKHYSIENTARIMAKVGLRRFPVVEDGVVEGIVTPQDVLEHFYKLGFHLNKEPIHTAMEKRVLSISPEKDLYEAVKIMKLRDIGGLPVVENNKLVGIITEMDVLDTLSI